MTKLTLVTAFVAGLGALTPMVANAGALFTPHDRLVHEINNSYGTQFKVAGHNVNNAANRDQSSAHRG